MQGIEFMQEGTLLEGSVCGAVLLETCEEWSLPHFWWLWSWRAYIVLKKPRNKNSSEQ